MKTKSIVAIVILTFHISCKSQELNLKINDLDEDATEQNDSLFLIGEQDFLILCNHRNIVPKKTIDSLFEKTNNKIDFNLLYGGWTTGQLKNRILYEVLQGNKKYEQIFLEGLISQKNNRYADKTLYDWHVSVLKSWAPSDLKTKFLLDYLPEPLPDCSNFPPEISGGMGIYRLAPESSSNLIALILYNYKIEDIEHIVEYLNEIHRDYFVNPHYRELTNCEVLSKIVKYIRNEIITLSEQGKLRPQDPIEYFSIVHGKFAKKTGNYETFSKYSNKSLYDAIRNTPDR